MNAINDLMSQKFLQLVLHEEDMNSSAGGIIRNILEYQLGDQSSNLSRASFYSKISSDF